MSRVNEVLKQWIIERDEREALVSKLNCIVVGKTGVGKSTLINALLGEKKSEVGYGSRGTQDLAMLTPDAQPYTSKTSIFAFYDTLGLELDNHNLSLQSVLNKGSVDKIASAIEKKIEHHRKLRNKETYIHCVFYCINAMGDRLEDVEIDFMKRIAKTGVQVFPVLTKVQDELSIFNLIQKFQGQTGFEPILTRAVDIVIEGEAIENPFSIQAMVEFMEENKAGIVYIVNKNFHIKNWKQDKKKALKYFSDEAKDNTRAMSFISAAKKANKYLGLTSDAEEFTLFEQEFYQPVAFERTNEKGHYAEADKLKSGLQKGLSSTIGNFKMPRVKDMVNHKPKASIKVTQKATSSMNKISKEALKGSLVNVGVSVGIDIMSDAAIDIKDKLLETKHLRDEFKKSGLTYLDSIEKIQKELYV